MFYIKERHNPQTGVYYCAEGQLSKTEAKRMESPLYGHNVMLAFETEGQYEAAKLEILARGGRFI